jgi:hypothetical protein
MESLMIRRLVVTLFLASLVATSGCAWLHAKKIAKRTNPAYRTGAIPGPTRMLPVFECPRSRRDVSRDDAVRRRFESNLVPALWRAAGGTGEPMLGPEPSPAFCQELFESDSYPWAGNEALRAAVASQLADGEQSALVLFYAPTYSCNEKAGTVRDRNGVAVGSIGTGEEVCEDNGYAFVFAYLFAADGALIWHSGDTVGSREDGAAAAHRILEGFPHERVTLSTF